MRELLSGTYGLVPSIMDISMGFRILTEGYCVSIQNASLHYSVVYMDHSFQHDC